MPNDDETIEFANLDDETNEEDQGIASPQTSSDLLTLASDAEAAGDWEKARTLKAQSVGIMSGFYSESATPTPAAPPEPEKPLAERIAEAEASGDFARSIALKTQLVQGMRPRFE